MTDDFSKHPPTIGELRSDRERSPASWTPRDLLISLLRDIDAGTIEPEAMVVTWRGPIESDVDDAVKGWAAASPDLVTTVGLLAYATNRVIENRS